MLGRRAARRLAALLLGTIICLMAGHARAAGDPTLEWWTIETEHFRFHYERDLEKVAVQVARHSEAIHQRLVGPLGYAPAERTEVAIIDSTDSANGSATAIPFNTIRLFVTAPDDLSPLGDYDDWYLSLMTHEYTHVLHTDNVSGIPALVNAVLGKTLIPNQLQPRWFLEGLAVVEESAHTSGGRIRSSLFDMYLRGDFLDDNFARIDQISAAPRRWPGATMWYLYGGRFLNWIADVYGHEVLRAVAVDYGASLIPWAINRAIRRQTGRTYVQLYEGFLSHLRSRYRKQIVALRRRGIREGSRLTYHGRNVKYPHFVPSSARTKGAGQQLLYYRADGDNRGGLYQLEIAKASRQNPLAEDLVARVSGAGNASYGPDGELVFSSVAPHARVYRRTDLFRLPPGKSAPHGSESYRQRLTTGLRANAPTVSPDGKKVVFTRNNRGTTTLMIADREADGSLLRIRTLLRGQRFDQVYTPTFSPDGKKIALSSWQAGGFRDVQVLDLASRKLTSITHDRAIDAGPTWSPDGRRLYFSSDRTGIYNVYAHDLDAKKLFQVTNVRSGALMPTISDDGKTLAYVGYTTEGFDLYVMELTDDALMPAPPPRNTRPLPHRSAPEVAMEKYRYNALSTLRPRSFSFSYEPGNFGSNALTITAGGGDIAGHHRLAASVVADPAAPGPQFAFDYGYGRLPVDLGLQLSNRLVPRSEYRISDREPEYVERSYSARSSLSYTHPGEFAQQRFSISYTASVLDADLPVADSGPLDPYASPTIEPLSGLFSTFHLGYSFSNVEGSRNTLGAARGFALNLGLDYADEGIGSVETLYLGRYTAVGYLSMPWPGHHTLAIRSAGGLAKGRFSRRGVFFLGGYNLENLDLLDTITSGAFNGAFVLRGYEPSTFRGSSFLLSNLEYRFPIYEADRGFLTFPVYLNQVGGNLFVDHGGAFDQLDYDQIELLSNRSLIHSPSLHTGAGAELWIEMMLGYGLLTNMRVGYAHGFSSAAIEGGQAYFLAASAF